MPDFAHLAELYSYYYPPFLFMAASPGNDFFTTKSDAELLFIAQNPSYYHSDLVQTARRELQRRGVAIATTPAPEAAEASADLDVDFDALPTNRPWLVPAVGGGLLVLILGFFLLRPTPSPAPKPKPAPPAELVSVETHVLPSFDALTETQLGKMPAALPPGETADTSARRKYLLLARRFWDAENQSAYLYDQVQAGKVAPTLPGQIDMTLDKWRRLTSALVYDHKLQPGMTARLELMRQGALVRRESLGRMSQLYGRDEFPLNDDLVFLNDSVQYIRQILLGVPLAQRQRPVKRHQDFSAFNPDVKAVLELPATRSLRNPLYVLDGHPLASDPSTGAAPAEVEQLDSQEIENIVVLKGKAAVELYGPRAHDGAVVIITRHPQ